LHGCHRMLPTKQSCGSLSCYCELFAIKIEAGSKP
jgi:hypothetical protein